MNLRVLEGGGITSPRGYETGAVYVGVKSHKSYKPDVAILYTKRPAACAALFTTNRFCAAPVLVDREILRAGRPVHGVVINSGNANAGTGAAGLASARRVEALAEELLGLDAGEMFVSSTGVIGERYPVEKVEDAVRRIVPTLSPESGTDAAWAIMTTDRHKKEYACELTLSGGCVRIGAMAKGSGMIHPNMATTLTFITTDAAIDRDVLQEMLRTACDGSLHMLTVDGDISTNDSMFLFANGASGVAVESEADRAAFGAALNELCSDIARRIAADGEGACRSLVVEAAGLLSNEDARSVARIVAGSTAVKKALGALRLHWGPVLTAVGCARAELSSEHLSCRVSSAAGELVLAQEGMGTEVNPERLEDVLTEPEVTLSLDFHMGPYRATAYGCDLTGEYVRLNGDYRT